MLTCSNGCGKVLQFMEGSIRLIWVCGEQHMVCEECKQKLLKSMNFDKLSPKTQRYVLTGEE